LLQSACLSRLLRRCCRRPDGCLIVVVSGILFACQSPDAGPGESAHADVSVLGALTTAAAFGVDAKQGITEQSPHKIVLNQVGYYQTGPKVALVTYPKSTITGNWQIEHARRGDIILKGRLASSRKDSLTGLNVADVDFSSLTLPGRYRLAVAGTRSLEFSVSVDPYRALLTDLWRSFYLQRCGVEIDDPVTGIARPACHVNDADYAHADLAFASHAHDQTTGGWHDAGDYGKYVATAAVSITEILSRYEQFPVALSATVLNIPESGNNLPDVLDEMKVGLDWLLSMQRADGALYRKLSGKAWPKLVPPEEDTQSRYLFGPSTSDTAKAIASFAIAARTFMASDQVAARNYLAAARLGWHFLSQQPDMLFDYREGDDSGSGPYRANDTDVESSLRHDRDDRLAAAIELYLATGDAQFINTIHATLPDHTLRLFEWKDPATQSLVNFYWHPRSQSHATLRTIIKSKLLARATEAMERASTNSWRVANTRFIWGSNKMAAEEGVLLVQAWRLTGDVTYRDAAIDQLDYLLGRNPNHQSYVTGEAAGQRSVQNVAHIYVRATGTKIPGLLVGGPNIKAQAKIAPADRGPMSYIDDARSYATNEYAIDYTSALIALLVDLKEAQTPLYSGAARFSGLSL